MLTDESHKREYVKGRETVKSEQDKKEDQRERDDKQTVGFAGPAQVERAVSPNRGTTLPILVLWWRYNTAGQYIPLVHSGTRLGGLDWWRFRRLGLGLSDVDCSVPTSNFLYGYLRSTVLYWTYRARTMVQSQTIVCTPQECCLWPKLKAQMKLHRIGSSCIPSGVIIA